MNYVYQHNSKGKSNSKEISLPWWRKWWFWPLINKAKVMGVELNIMVVICYSSRCLRALLCTLCSAASQKSSQTQNPVTNNRIFFIYINFRAFKAHTCSCLISPDGRRDARKKADKSREQKKTKKSTMEHYIYCCCVCSLLPEEKWAHWFALLGS